MSVARYGLNIKSMGVQEDIMKNFQERANFIWQVADDILRGAFKQHEYGEVILPFVVLRRLDCVLVAKNVEKGAMGSA